MRRYVVTATTQVFSSIAAGCASPSATQGAAVARVMSADAAQLADEWSVIVSDPDHLARDSAARRPLVILWRDGLCMRIGFGPLSGGVHAGRSPETIALARRVSRTPWLAQLANSEHRSSSLGAVSALAIVGQGRSVMLTAKASRAVPAPDEAAAAGDAIGSQSAETEIRRAWSTIEAELMIAGAGLRADHADSSLARSARERLATHPDADWLRVVRWAIEVADSAATDVSPRIGGGMPPADPAVVLALVSATADPGEKESLSPNVVVLWSDGLLSRFAAAGGERRFYSGRIGPGDVQRIIHFATDSRVLAAAGLVLSPGGVDEHGVVLRTDEGPRWAVWDGRLATVANAMPSDAAAEWIGDWSTLASWLVQAPATEVFPGNGESAVPELDEAIERRLQALGLSRSDGIGLFTTLRAPAFGPGQ